MLLSVHVTSILFLVWFNKFRPEYGLLLELHTLTLVACFYALLLQLGHFFLTEIFSSLDLIDVLRYLINGVSGIVYCLVVRMFVCS